MTMSQSNSKQNGSIQKFRAKIALWLIAGSIVAFIALAYVFVSTAVTPQDKKDAGEKIFMMIVPLLGTWVGTVIAYYFSGEAYEKASQSVSDFVKQVSEKKLATIPVQEAMIPKKSIACIILKKGEDGSKINLQEGLINKFKPPVTRMPVLDEKGIAKYIIHQSLIYKFITERTIAMAGKTPPFDVSKQTLKDFLDFKNMKQEVGTSFAFVSVDESLAEAKKEMESVENCQDVFVTDDGSSNKPVLGWLTNIDIAKHLRV